jgi:hypothetical protein
MIFHAKSGSGGGPLGVFAYNIAYNHPPPEATDRHRLLFTCICLHLPAFNQIAGVAKSLIELNNLSPRRY